MKNFKSMPDSKNFLIFAVALLLIGGPVYAQSMEEYGEPTTNENSSFPVSRPEQVEADDEEIVIEQPSRHMTETKTEVVEKSFKKTSLEDSDVETEPDFWTPKNRLRKFEFGLQSSWRVYREPDLMRQKGWMYGMYANYTHRFADNSRIHSWKDALKDSRMLNLIKIETRFAGGDMDYESVRTGKLDHERDYLFEGRVLLGYDIFISEQTRLTPFAGAGYRYLHNESYNRRSTTGHLGYNRESNYFYAPIGVELETPIRGTWKFGATGEYDLFIYGRQYSHLEDYGGGLPELKHDQNDGYGLRGSFRIKKDNEVFDVIVEPFVQYWHIKDSEIVSGTLEPDNNTVEYGFRIGLAY